MPFVSEATIRRDLKALAGNGQVRRVRGGIESPNRLPPLLPCHAAGGSVATPVERAIAREAAKLVKDGENIIIAGSTTTDAMFEFIQEKRLDVLTNSVFLSNRLYEASRSRVMLPGGTMLREQGIVLSPYENDCSEHFTGQKMFTSCYGFSRGGLMETDPLVVSAQRRLLARADEVIVLVDSAKLRQRSSMIVATLNRISTLITDDGADRVQLEPFRRRGLTVIVARERRQAAVAAAKR